MHNHYIAIVITVLSMLTTHNNNITCIWK